MDIHEAQRVKRGVDDPDVAALRLERQEIAPRSGDAQHVAERAEDDAGPRGDRVGAVDHLERRYADRAARPVEQFDLRRAKAVDSILHDPMSLASADLHYGPV